MVTNTVATKGSVFLVDDDPAVQRGVAALLSAADYGVSVFTSGDQFLENLPSIDHHGAVLLIDVCMPGIQGLDVQMRLRDDKVALPVIVMTAHGDVPMAVRAMQNGAVDFLEKPFTVDEVTSALDRAFAAALSAKAPQSDPALSARYENLTPRECEVMHEIVRGGANKEIARVLNVSPRTVEAHRHNVMAKMEAHGVADLVRMAVSLDIKLN